MKTEAEEITELLHKIDSLNDTIKQHILDYENMYDLYKEKSKEVDEQDAQITIIRLELDKAIEQKQLSFKVCEQLMENEKFYQKEFERLRNELQQAKLGNP